jgi:PAS domain S-box-containing protein
MVTLQRWLAAYRAAYFLHGLVWAAGAVILLPQIDHAEFDRFLLVYAAVCTGGLVAAAFDLAAAAAFALPAIAPVFVRLFLDVEGRADPALGAALGLLLVVLLLVGARMSRTVREIVRARLAEARRTEDARRHAEVAERMREQLTAQHGLLQQLLRATPQGVWFLDAAGLTTDLNPAMCRLLGRSREEALGRNVREFFAGDELRRLERELGTRAQGVASVYEIDIVRPDGSVSHCLNHATPLAGAAGERIGSVGLWTDVSAQRRSEQTLQRYAFAMNSVTDAVSVVDEDTRYEMVNDAWCRLTGVPREQALGRLTFDVLGGSGLVNAERRAALQTCLNERRTVEVTTTRVGADGRAQHLQTAFMPYLGGGEHDAGSAPRSAVLLTRDVTRQVLDREAIATGAQLLRHTLDATGDAIFASDAATAADPTQPVRFINDPMLRMWGLDDRDPTRLTGADLMAAAMPLFADPQKEAAIIAEVIAHNARHERHLHLKDGRVLLRRCEPAVVGGRTMRVWSFRDITAEERMLAVLQANEAEQRALLSAFPGYIAACDQNLRYIYANSRFAGRLGRAPQDIIGRSLHEVLPAQIVARAEAETRAAFAGEVVRAQREYPPLAGVGADDPRSSHLHLEVTLVAGPATADGKRVCYVFGQDITERVRAEQALLAARDEAEQANRAKSRFLAQMSHELRTPLNAIMGFAQLLERDARRPLDAQQSGYVGEILRGADHLLELINEVLDLGRIEAGHLLLNTEAVALAPLLGECHALVQPLAQERGVVLRALPGVPAATHVRADRMRLKQVVLNLLANAIKYNRSGGEVELVVGAAAPNAPAGRAAGEGRSAAGAHVAPVARGALVRIAVRDSGPGLTEAECARLFRPFERLGAERGEVEGTGIGLALSRRLVEAMEGGIGVTSRPGEGSTFWIDLPAAGAPATEAAAGAAPGASRRETQPSELGASDSRAAGERGATVLYVDDNPVNLVLMEAMLGLMDPPPRLVSAESAVEGLKLARRERPTLILLDIQLPGMDGFQVLARLRAAGLAAEIGVVPVVAVSANAMPADIEAALAAGFADYLTKPLELPRLHATVRKLLAVTPGQAR